MSEPSDKDSTTSSGWSDEEGDEYLARALASDEYLQGSKGGYSSSAIAATEADGAQTQQHGRATTTTLHAPTGNPGTTAAEKRETILIHHPLCELHDIPDHPERPGRVRAIMNALTRNFPDICTLLAPEATENQILRFHGKAHVDNISRLCSESERKGRIAAVAPPSTKGKGKGGARRGGADARYAAIVQIDPDTAVMPASRGAIFRAAGAACFAVDEVMSGAAVNAFCCVRPPGHHAEPDKAMGFCYFNNAPIGALHAKAVHGADRVAIVDIDVHHGNGTQALFKADPAMFYASTHQGPEFYPGTGHEDITGVGNNIVNVGMREGAGSSAFRKEYSEKILPALEAFRPGLIIISAGFDAHVDDPLAGITLDEEDYGWVTQKICAVAEKVCGRRVVSILEGGYNLQAISESAVAHVHALRQAAAAAPPPPPSEQTAALSMATAKVTATTEEGVRSTVAAEATVAASTAAAASTIPTRTPPPAAAAAAEQPTSEQEGSEKPSPQRPSETPTPAAPMASSEVADIPVLSAEAGPGVDSGAEASPTEGQWTRGGEIEGDEYGTPGALREEDQEEIDLMLAQLSLQDGEDTGEQEETGTDGEDVSLVL